MGGNFVTALSPNLFRRKAPALTYLYVPFSCVKYEAVSGLQRLRLSKYFVCANFGRVSNQL